MRVFCFDCNVFVGLLRVGNGGDGGGLLVVVSVFCVELFSIDVLMCVRDCER